MKSHGKAKKRNQISTASGNLVKHIIDEQQLPPSQPATGASKNKSESEDDSSDSSELDFLPPLPDWISSSSDSLPEERQQQQHDDDGENVDEENASNEVSPPRRQSQNTGRSKSRKQAKPKKRKDGVTREIIRLQSSTKLLIPKLPFQRVVREVLQQFKTDFRMQSTTLECLHEAAECYLVSLFEDAYICCLHRSRQTLSEKDMRLVQVLRGPNEGRR